MIFFFITICRQKGTYLNLRPLPALKPAPSLKPLPPPGRRRKLTNPWVMSWILHREDRIHTDILGYQNFFRKPPAFFCLIEERIHHHFKSSLTNFRKPLGIGLKLAITMRHLATGETYTSLQYNWLVGQTTICKFIPQVCRAILAEFQEEYLTYPTDPEDWKNVEEKFRTRWNVPHALGVLDEKHIAMKEPKKSGSEYYNCKGFFSLVLLTLVDANYRFLWVGIGSSGSPSDAQIFN